MNETLSHRLDIIEQIEVEKEQKEIQRIIKLDKKIDRLVVKQFNKARLILGHRLSMDKSHSNYFLFYFEVYKSVYLRCSIHKHETINDPRWDFDQNCSLAKVSYDFKYFNKKLKTNEISTAIIEIVNCYFKERDNDN